MKPLFFTIVLCFSSFYSFLSAQFIICKAEVNVDISSTGSVDLTPEMLLISPLNPDMRYELSRTHFNCADVNNTYVVFTYEYSGSVLMNYCWSSVTIANRFSTENPCRLPRLWCLISTTVFLNAFGEATVTPEMIIPDPLNPAFNYSVVPSTFDCSDIGNQSVVVTLTGTEGATLSCNANVRITNPVSFASPCYRLIMRNIRFLPYHIFQQTIRPGTPLPFELEIAKSEIIKKQINGEFIFVLSKDQDLDQSDKLLFSKKIRMNNKDQAFGINDKMLIPQHLLPGEYYLLGDIISTDKKENIGFERFVQKVTIGNAPQINNSLENRNKDITGHITVYPNPFADQFILSVPSFDQGQYEIYDAFGKLWAKSEIKSSEQSIDASTFPAGCYFIKVQASGNELKVVKLIKSE